MASGIIWTPEERTTQPRHITRVDWTNPLSRGLKIAVVPSSGARNLAHSKSSSTLPIEEVTAAKLRALRWQKATTNVFDTGYKNSAITAYSMLALVNNASISGSLGYLISNRQAGGNAGVAVFTGAGASSPNQTAHIVVVHGGVALYTKSSNSVAGVVNTGYVAFGLSATVGSQLRYCVDGAFDSPVTIGSMNSSNDNLCIGQDLLDTANNGDYNLGVLFWWDRALSDAEMLSAQINPWQLFEADNDPVFYSLGGSPVTINCATGAALASDYAANVASPITVSAAVGAAVANDYAAGVSSPITIAASAGAAVASDYAANVASAITVAGNVGAAVGAGLSASVSSGSTISATTGAAIGAGLATGVASPITVAASVGAATASGLSAGISTGNEIAASTGAAVAAGLAAGVASPITVASSVGAAAASGLQATVSTGATVPAGLGAAIALGLTANIAGQITIPAALGRALGVGLQAAITVGDEIAASIGAATAAGLAATIANPTVALTAATGIRGGFGVQMQLAARRAQIQTGRRRN